MRQYLYGAYIVIKHQKRLDVMYAASTAQIWTANTNVWGASWGTELIIDYLWEYYRLLTSDSTSTDRGWAYVSELMLCIMWCYWPLIHHKLCEYHLEQVEAGSVHSQHLVLDGSVGQEHCRPQHVASLVLGRWRGEVTHGAVHLQESILAEWPRLGISLRCLWVGWGRVGPGTS